MKKVCTKLHLSVMVFSLSFALALTGCVSNLIDKTPKQEDVQQSLMIGSTTKAEVEAKFGKPSSVTSKKGADTWTYVWGADGNKSAVGDAVSDSVKTAAWGAGHVATGQAMVHASNAGAKAGGMAGGVAAGMLAAEAGSRLTNAATGMGTGKSTSSKQPTQLTVYFDKNGIVKDYKYSGNK